MSEELSSQAEQMNSAIAYFQVDADDTAERHISAAQEKKRPAGENHKKQTAEINGNKKDKNKHKDNNKDSDDLLHNDDGFNEF